MIQPQKPFRFGVFAHNTSPSLVELTRLAQRAEALGYATLLIPDHIGDAFAAALALAHVAHVTQRLRVGSFVFCNDFRHPVLLARDAFALNALSNGRFELGLGAGWMQSEYEQCGIEFATPGTRIERLAESIQIIKPLLRGEEVTYTGKHYSIQRARAIPAGAQSVHLPLFMGGSGKKMLTLAAASADIVGFAPRTLAPEVAEHMNQAIDINDTLPAALARKLAWVRAGAGPRFADLELNILILEVVITTDRQEAAQQLAARYNLSPDQILSIPHFLIGDHQQISHQIHTLRAHYGISYLVIWEEHIEALAPLIPQLTHPHP